MLLAFWLPGASWREAGLRASTRRMRTQTQTSTRKPRPGVCPQHPLGSPLTAPSPCFDIHVDHCRVGQDDQWARPSRIKHLSLSAIWDTRRWQVAVAGYQCRFWREASSCSGLAHLAPLGKEVACLLSWRVTNAFPTFHLLGNSINPVTGRVEEKPPNPMEGMTEEQKEHEAMKLVTMFDKLSRCVA